MDALYFIYTIGILIGLMMNYVCVGLAFFVDDIDSKLKFWLILIPGVGYLYFAFWAIKELGTVAYKDMKEFLTEQYQKL